MCDPKRKKTRPIETIGPYGFNDAEGAFAITSDPLLLADFVLPLETDDRVIDLGTGAGVIPLVLSWKSAVQTIVGVELNSAAAAVARGNVERNGLLSRVTVVEGDLRELEDLNIEGPFSLVVCNPPYVKKGAGRLSPCSARAMARHELTGSLEEFLSAARRLVAADGRISFIYPAARFVEAAGAVKESGLEPVRIRFVHTGKDGRARLFLMEARASVGGLIGELVIEPPLFI